jgi:hypothetical protein
MNETLDEIVLLEKASPRAGAMTNQRLSPPGIILEDTAMGDETFSGAAHAIMNPVEQGFSF